MNKRLLSMFLALCMVVTLLPVSAMAEGADTPVGISGEITAFAPLTETEKTVTTGTSIEDLDLPETLTATVRTAVIAGEEPVQDSGSPDEDAAVDDSVVATTSSAIEGEVSEPGETGEVTGPEWEENTVEVPVTWTSEPEYDMDTEGAYVFTPVIEGYTLSAELPEITVTVGAAMLRGLVSPLSVTTYDIWVGGTQVTSDNKEDVLGAADGDGATVTYDPDNNTLTLNNAYSNIPYTNSGNGIQGIYATGDLNIVLVGASTVTVTEYASVGESVAISVPNGNLTISGDGSLTANGGTVSESNCASCGIVAASLTINGGTVVAKAGTTVSNMSWGIYSSAKPIFNGGTITAIGNNQAIMTTAPNLSGYTDVKVTAGTNASETGATVINKETLTSSFNSYRYLKFEPAASTDVAEIGSTGYATLQAAVDAVTNGQIIKLLDNITLTASVTIASGNSNSFTLDLNGKKLDGGSSNPGIRHTGGGTLIVTDSDGGGTISGISGIYCNSENGVLNIVGGTVSAGNNGIWIDKGSVKVTGGTISGGTYGYGIYNSGSGTVNVSGGTINGGNGGDGIYNYGSGTVNVSGGTISGGRSGIQNENNNAAIAVSGGTISGNSCGIQYTNSGGTLTISRGTSIIQGKSIAITNVTPTLDGVTGTASANYDGTSAVAYNAANINSYKYLKFEQDPNVAQIGGTGYATLQAAVTAVTDGQTIKLLNDVSENITIINGNTYSFTLDLNGRTLSGNTQGEGTGIPIAHNGSGTLTVTDSSGGKNGKVTASYTAIDLNRGSLVVAGGTVESTIGTAIYNSKDSSVSITSGTVTTNSTQAAIMNSGSNSVSVSGGTVKNTGNGPAIYNYTNGKITISGTALLTCANENAYSYASTIYLTGGTSSDTVLEITGGTIENTATGGYAIYNGAYGKVSVTSGSPVIKGGSKAMNKAPDLSGYTRVEVTASAKFDGSSPVTQYVAEQVFLYRYLTFAASTGTTVTSLNLTNKLTAPVISGTPAKSVTDDQYTGTVTWIDNSTKFLGGTVYYAQVTMTAKEGYTFSGVAANAFSYTGADSVTNYAAYGKVLTVSIKFPATAAKVLQSIVITTAPIKTTYKYGETFSTAGMVVKATYNDGSVNANFTDYEVDKTGTLTMSDTTITLTANGTSITTTQAITVTKADGPVAPSVNFSFDGANANKLMGATASMEYSLDGGSSWTDCTADMDLTANLGSITAENDIKVRVKGTATHEVGAVQTTDITQASAPTIGKTDETSLGNNGSITGVSNLMEYKKSGATSYIAISGSTVTGLAPGEYLVRVKTTGTVLASPDATVTIAAFTKKTPTTGDLTYNLTAVDYNGSAKPLSVTKKTAGIGDITIYYDGSTTAPTNAGTYAITVDIAGNAEYNAVTGLSLGSYIINKTAYPGTTTVSANVLASGQTGATVVLPTLPTGASYGTPVAGGAITMTGMSIAGTTLTYTAPASTSGQTGTMTIPVTGATNYNNYSIVVTVTSTAKTPQVISFADTAVAKTYGDAKFVNPLTQTTVNGIITYASDDASVATVNPSTGEVTIVAVGDGSATITATAAETSTHAQATASYTVTVAKKALTLKAVDKSMTKGNELPAFTYTVTGLVNSDAVTAAPTMSTTTDGTAVGTFDITITGGEVANAASYDITYTKGTLTVAERLFTATVTNGTGGGSYAEGATVTITANDRSGYTFTGWSGADVTFANASAKTTTFTMPANAVTVTANYRQNSSGGDGGGSGGGGGSSSNDNSRSVIVTPPTPDKPNSPTQGEIKVPGTVNGKGNITVNITDKTVADAFDKALADAKKNGNEQNGITVVLRVDTGSKTGSNVTVNLPKTVQDTIIEKKIVSTIVVVDNPDIRIGMDLATIKEISKQAKSDVNITATRTDSGKLTGDAKKAIGSRPVFDLKVNYGKGKQVQSFGTGSVSVTIPYTLGANEKAGNVQAVYIDGNGKVHWLVNSVYDSVEKVLRFATSHFSTYGIGYKQQSTAFTDIAGHWAKEDIEFVVSRGLFSGTSTTTFSPNTAMTRGMFVIALGRLANANVSGYAKSSFTDVKSDAYYMGYIEWASKNNIVNGVGNNKFAPDQSITREQMAVIMQNYAKVIGFILPKVHTENTFVDNAKISAYAKDAVKQMQMAGVLSGKNGNLFDPQGTATRAEVSAVLRRFVELAISSDTMQGWTRNDSGQWMYYENGKPITGKKEIDGSTYTFDQYGVTTDVPKNLKYATYTVQKGDSFWLIARKLGCTMSELERLNNKSRFALIHPGDVLRVPEK
jgi:uncharacterized repeat protein (TIGR02543 family)